MPRLIVLVRNYLPYSNAVGVCAESIISEFISRYTDFHAVVVCEKSKSNQVDYEVINKTEVYRFLTKRTKRIIERRNIVSRFLSRILNYLYDVFSLYTGNREMIKLFYDKLTELDISNNDIVIPFCAPFESVIACEKKSKIKRFNFIPILYDLYSGCAYTNRNRFNKLIKYPFNRHFENQMEVLSTHIIFSRVWEKYLKSSIYQKKATRSEVPLFFPRTESKSESVFDGKNKNVVYCGNFNKKIRTSTLFCNFFNEVLKDRTDIVLHVIGNGCSDKNIIALKNAHNTNVVLYGYIPHEKVISYLNQCDIIVIVGNKENKQFPSKIVEALSFSKKMLILTKKPSIYYELFVNNADCILINNSKKKSVSVFNDFLQSPVSNTNYYDKECFKEFTPKYVTSIIYSEGKANAK